jgi:phosphate transport system substrate-binding protein
MVKDMSELMNKGEKKEEKVEMPHKGGRTTWLIAGVIVVAIIIVAAAFATGMLSTSSKETITLTGSGATFPMPLILKWAEVYYGNVSKNVRINYGGGGSGQGVTQIEGKLVDFAGSDAPVNLENTTEYGLVHIPETCGSVVVAFNLPGITSLRLNGTVLADIFMKNITMWDDSNIAALNPGVSLPSQPITTVTRSDASGTTFVFSGYLSIVSPTFATLYKQGKSVAWPQGTQGANGNPGVTQTVQSTPYSVGYIELTYAMQNSITYATLQNKDGYWVNATLESTAAAAAGISLPAWDADWANVNILNSPGQDAYPIASFTYILIYKELYNDQSKMNKTTANELIKFLWWAVHDGQSYSTDLHYAPLPSSVVQFDEQILNSITYKGTPVR